MTSPHSPAEDRAVFVNDYMVRISASSLPRPDQDCSICGQHMSECPRPPEPHACAMEDQECAVQVVFPGCMHVFGIKCFGKLILSDGPTSNKCPLCRTVWFKKLDPWRVG